MKWICFGVVVWVASAARATEAVLVENSRAKCVVAVPDQAASVDRLAATDLRWHLQRATGSEVPLLSEAEAEKLPAEMVRLVVGSGSLAKKSGITPQGPKPGEYRIKTLDNSVCFIGNDSAGRRDRPDSPATLYSVAYFLDRYLGVRWLWPGELGTFVPRRTNFILPTLDITARPSLEKRILRMSGSSARAAAPGSPPDAARAKISEEAWLWSARHQLGTETEFKFGHSFMDWWDKYHDAHPDYFATPPPGQKAGRTDRVKLCVSNPNVADQIIVEWKAAGTPDIWNVCPNDGTGFCTCERCCALDRAGDQSAEDIWAGRANLTGRYLTLWNGLLQRMKDLNPRVRLCSYAYSAYRNPPADLQVKGGLVLGFVHTYWAQKEWAAWSDLGVKLLLRPNWWHTAGIAPHVPLHRQGEFFQFARQHGMVGFDFDSLHGYWATQGPNYYMIARLAARPDLSVDDVIAEYCSAFGPAAQSIRQYLDYWEAWTEKMAFATSAGGGVSQDPDGPYDKLCREHNWPIQPLGTSWRVLPELCDVKVVQEAEAILHQADQTAGKSDAEVTARIQFLRDGLRHLSLTRDVIGLAYSNKGPLDERKKALAQKVKELHALQDELSPRHVVWGHVVRNTMRTRNIAPEGRSAKALSLEGL